MKVARAIIAKNIRLMRGALGMTQEDLAGLAQMDRTYLIEIEHEEKSISADKVEDLARAFGVEIYEMFHPDTAAAYQERHKHHAQAKFKAERGSRKAKL